MNAKMSVDLGLMHLLNVSLQSTWLDPIMWVLTVSLPGLLLVPVVLYRRGLKREAVLLASTVLVSGLLAVEIQLVTLRPRPEAARLLMALPSFPSFPSGHAAMGFGWATFIALRFRRWTAPMLVAGAIAVSRVYVGHHFPSDVLLGAVLGAATGAVAFGCFFAAPGTRPRWAWWIWAQLAVVLFAGIGAYLGLTDFGFLRYAYADKVMHFVLFGALAFFLVAWFADRSAVWVIGLFLAVAVLDELVQALSPVRTFDLGDLTCTTLGILAGGWLGRLVVLRLVRVWPRNLQEDETMAVEVL